MDEQPHTAVIEAIKNAPLKLSFLVHFILTSWGVQGYWSPDSYFFYNLLFFLTLLWTIHSKDSADAPFLCLIINTTAVLLDLVTMCVYFPRSSYGPADRFSAGMAVLNLVVRPVSCIALHKVWLQRKTDGGGPEVRPSTSYQGIDGQTYGTTAPNF